MKKNNYYIRGFTFIEMAISITIAAIGTGTMMFVFNAAQTRYFNDQMEASIDTYCNNAVDFISTIVSRSDSIIEQSSKNPPQYKIWQFNDLYDNQWSEERNDHHRIITIEMTDKGGVVIRENNRDVTGELYNKYMLRNHKKDNNGYYDRGNREWNALALQGSFNPGNKFQDGDENLTTQYVFDSFKIKKMDPGAVDINFFHNIVNNRIKEPLEDCTYDIQIKVRIENKVDKNTLSSELYTYRTYTKRAYCPSCFMLQRSRKQNKAKNI